MVWKAGAAVEVAWNQKAWHGGGYSYRLCPAEKELTEECFQANPLDFVGNSSLRWCVCPSLPLHAPPTMRRREPGRRAGRQAGSAGRIDLLCLLLFSSTLTLLRFLLASLLRSPPQVVQLSNQLPWRALAQGRHRRRASKLQLNSPGLGCQRRYYPCGLHVAQGSDPTWAVGVEVLRRELRTGALLWLTSL